MKKFRIVVFAALGAVFLAATASAQTTQPDAKRLAELRNAVKDNGDVDAARELIAYLKGRLEPWDQVELIGLYGQFGQVSNALGVVTTALKAGLSEPGMVDMYCANLPPDEAVRFAWEQRGRFVPWRLNSVIAALAAAPNGSPLAALRDAVNSGKLTEPVLKAAGLDVTNLVAEQKAVADNMAKRLKGTKAGGVSPKLTAEIVTWFGIGALNEFSAKVAALPATVKLD